MFRRDYASADQSDDLDSLARYDVCCCNEHIFLPFDLLYDRLTFLSPALYLHFSKANNTALTNEADRKIRIEQLKGFFAMHVDKGYLEKMASTAEEVKEAIVEEQFDEEAQADVIDDFEDFLDNDEDIEEFISKPAVEPKPVIEEPNESSLLERILNEDTDTHEFLKDIISDEEPEEKPFELTAPVISLDRAFKEKMTSTAPFMPIEASYEKATSPESSEMIINRNRVFVVEPEAESEMGFEEGSEFELESEFEPELELVPEKLIQTQPESEAANVAEVAADSQVEDAPKITLKPKSTVKTQVSQTTHPARVKTSTPPLTPDDKALIAIAVIEIAALIVFALAHGLGYLTAAVGMLGLIAGGLLAVRGKARTLSKVAGVVFSIIAVVVSLAFIAIGIASFAPQQQSPQENVENVQPQDDENVAPGETPLDQPAEPQTPLFSQVQWLMNADDIGYTTYKGESSDPIDNHLDPSWDATCGYGIAQKTLRVSARSVVDAYGPEEVHVSVNIKYPEVTSTSRDMSAVNAKFAEMANNIASVYYAPTPDMVAMRNSSGGHDIKAETDYVITYNDADLISIVFTGSVSVGNAQMERPYIEAACVNLNTGRIYTFEDILEMTPGLANEWVADVRNNHSQGRWAVETFGADTLAGEIAKCGTGRIGYPMPYIAANREVRLIAPCALRVSNEVFRSAISCKVNDTIREDAKESSFWEFF